MDIAQQAELIDNIRSIVEAHLGQRVKLRANMGRSKVIESEGIITQAHPSLFIIDIRSKRGKSSIHSYQYVDILTGMVELTDVESGEKLFEPPFES